ncbi:hypothetical protein CN941_28640 [Bacillus cereus]|nr:hypothetical protein CN527_16700 [Bacillus cereus]PEZ84664.1 hypothetical protein CN374_27180 [Bacillus cereus]PFC00717.1 hypothetical protein CN296_08735 [Bacillus cereus]PFE53675.1 hypothetical protein CN318_20170 [Bacillus cereus]PFE68920.1 hypothetical protein CN316_16105 [Bacillus cereus]
MQSASIVVLFILLIIVGVAGSC